MKTNSKNLKTLTLTLSLAGSLIGSLLGTVGIAQAETDLKKSDAKSAVTKAVPVVVNLGIAPIGSRRKIENGKGGAALQSPVAAFPSREGPTPEGNALLGTAISSDPSARPELGSFQRKIPGDVFGGDSRLSRGADGKAKLQEVMQTLFNLLGDSSGEEAELQPGDTPYGNQDSMVGADAGQKKSGTPTGSTIAPSTYDDEGLHAADGGKTAKSHEGTTLGNIGTAIGTGMPSTPTGQALQQAMDQIESDSNPNAKKDDSEKPKGDGANAGGDSNNANEPKVTTSSDGNITKYEYPDGTVAVRNETNGTTTTLYKDGSTKTTKNGTGEVIDETPATSIPDQDHQGTPLPPVLQKQLDADIAALRAIGPKKESGNVDFGEGSEAGAPLGVVDKSIPVPDIKTRLINPGSRDAQTHPSSSDKQDRPSLEPDEDVIQYE